MIDLSTFLMRWFFLCGLMRDGPEIQTLPYTPYQHHQYQQYVHHPIQPPSIEPSQPEQGQQVQPEPYQDTSALVGVGTNGNPEESWRSQCLHGILSYPPGSQRELVMDAMRCELVQQLDYFLKTNDQNDNANDQSNSSSLSESSSKHVSASNSGSSARSAESRSKGASESRSGRTSLLQLQSKNKKKQIRDCLPQLVSAVLRSPAPHDSNLVDPVHQLRQIILAKCQQDPSWGIELCWLLEAEVGRNWKSMFEHLQQPGRRLIIAFPSDKAVAIAKIGVEKREAFDLLQDVETVTAYGTYNQHSHQTHHHHHHHTTQSTVLPSSISLLRCSHFGDTMQFVDRLTQISMDLRTVPAISRLDHLQGCLYEMNRRLRRRMVTRGQVSLDVEDQLGPFSWPTLKDMALDMVHHSVHFPLVPNAGTWPAGTSPKAEQGGVVRVLNIVVPQTRLLASRERCPYLVRLEIAETGFDGSDARLYATGAPQLGVTVAEALECAVDTDESDDDTNSNEQPCRSIPPELLTMAPDNYNYTATDNTALRGGYQPYVNDEDTYSADAYHSVRQHEYEQLHHHMQQQQQQQPRPPPPNNNQPQPQHYDNVNNNNNQNGNPPPPNFERPVVTLGDTLLDRVFGQPWKEVCDEVRKESPYGHVKGWQLASFILKAGEDIRQEALVMQMISKFKEWFETEIPPETRPFLRPYTIMCVGGDAGLVECLTDAKSVDEVKKVTDGFVSLRDYFERAYGPPGSQQHPQQSSTGGLTFEQAQDNFLRSLVGYSLVCYVLQIKDRHNANLLLDREGHIVHIDFGYVLGDMPKMAYVPTFTERAPFKLSDEFWDVLGGWNVKRGGLGVKFCKMFEEAFACASAHSDELACMVEGIMLTLKGNPTEARRCANSVRANLRMRGPPNSIQQKMFIRELIATAQTSWTTSSYDWLQRQMNGYL
ncbi:Phosphatidylinositol 4-kinase beta [Seminavis robusta]|uniref:Phosphatidylinositol 4-kinase beta n=1 Tax=Seminavis robusta TaxID=568900 RepID=A0A9N8DDU3_9STRA|nr:Phosphatidylinositol 4-kinase beta [Seminavis robusta]|eukprot:Sro48_g028060.1 Phosphatidylinositol 4-kinase beta (935) ;mRNA; f:4487-7545